MTAQNGQLPPIQTENVQPRPGALELQRIITARGSGAAPSPDDVAALMALRPSTIAPAIDVVTLIEQLHSDDASVRDQAWEVLAPLLTDPADHLDAISTHAVHPPPISWLVEGWMPDATLSVLTGAGGAGKSRIALQLAIAVSLGVEHFIMPAAISGRSLGLQRAPRVVDDGPVVFAAWETRRLAFANRLAAICGHDRERVDLIGRLDNRLHYVNMRPSGGMWGARSGAHTSTTGGWLPGGVALRSYAERAQARLLIIDPIAAAFVQNENDRALVRAFLSALDQWAEDVGCSVLIIAHPPKSDSALSGSTDWRNGVQAVWELAAADKNDPHGARTLKVDKLNEGPIPASVRVDFEAGRFVEVNEGKE